MTRTEFFRRAALIGLVFLVYAPALDRYFTSEDFLALRIVSERSWFDNLVASFASVYMDVSFVSYYRPVATAPLTLEFALFGVVPADQARTLRPQNGAPGCGRPARNKAPVGFSDVMNGQRYSYARASQPFALVERLEEGLGNERHEPAWQLLF